MTRIPTAFEKAKRSGELDLAELVRDQKAGDLKRQFENEKKVAAFLKKRAGDADHIQGLFDAEMDKRNAAANAAVKKSPNAPTEVDMGRQPFNQVGKSGSESSTARNFMDKGGGSQEGGASAQAALSQVDPYLVQKTSGTHEVPVKNAWGTFPMELRSQQTTQMPTGLNQAQARGLDQQAARDKQTAAQESRIAKTAEDRTRIMERNSVASAKQQSLQNLIGLTSTYKDLSPAAARDIAENYMDAEPKHLDEFFRAETTLKAQEGARVEERHKVFTTAAGQAIIRDNWEISIGKKQHNLAVLEQLRLKTGDKTRARQLDEQIALSTRDLNSQIRHRDLTSDRMDKMADIDAKYKTTMGDVAKGDAALRKRFAWGRFALDVRAEDRLERLTDIQERRAEHTEKLELLQEARTAASDPQRAKLLDAQINQMATKGIAMLEDVALARDSYESSLDQIELDNAFREGRQKFFEQAEMSRLKLGFEDLRLQQIKTDVFVQDYLDKRNPLPRAMSLADYHGVTDYPAGTKPRTAEQIRAAIETGTKLFIPTGEGGGYDAYETFELDKQDPGLFYTQIAAPALEGNLYTVRARAKGTKTGVSSIANERADSVRQVMAAAVSPTPSRQRDAARMQMDEWKLVGGWDERNNPMPVTKGVWSVNSAEFIKGWEFYSRVANPVAATMDPKIQEPITKEDKVEAKKVEGSILGSVGSLFGSTGSIFGKFPATED